MPQEVEDLREEGSDLAALLEKLGDADWARPTPFKAWTVFDVVGHLHYSDRCALAALDGRPAFEQETAAMQAVIAGGGSLRDFTREKLGALDARRLLDLWRGAFRTMCDRFAALDPKARLPWFGPDMGLRMFTTARQMETWAHGQDVYDLLERPRRYTDRLRGIAHIGVSTFGWTFANRGLPPPGPAPYVRLTAPSGALWEWNGPSDTNRIEGSAAEFCHVVTQNRNVADTSLAVVGEPAKRWMGLAQCFAGRPEDPPPPGARTGGAGPAALR
jgi:uncharacterized protein (TIGR03084 family)